MGKLPAHRMWPFDRAHGPEHIEWASQEGMIPHIVPLHSPYPALAARAMFRSKSEARP